MEKKTEGVKTLFIKPGSPWENGYIESFNGKFRDELLNREIFYTLEEAKILIEIWRKEYNQVRPHSALGYRPPAPEAIQIVSLAKPLLGLMPVGLTQIVAHTLGAGHNWDYGRVKTSLEGVIISKQTKVFDNSAMGKFSLDKKAYSEG